MAVGKREKKRRDKHARIRAAAFALFTEKGFAATTTKEVAERAGIATGTLFLYAKDKADLLFLVLHDRLRETVDGRLATVPPTGPLLEQLMHVFAGIFAMYAEHPALVQEFVKALPGADGPNAQAVNAYTFTFLTRLAALVDAGKERGEIEPQVESLRAASNIFFLYYGALLTWLAGMVDLDSALDPGLRASLALQIRGLATRSP